MNKDQNSNADIVILGGGPAGMAAAYELHRNGRHFTLVEKAASVGGLSRTYEFGAFKADHGPHRFYTRNRYVQELVAGLLEEHWIPVDRFSRFYIDGRFYRYPVEWKDALLNMGFLKAAHVLWDYCAAKLTHRGLVPQTFEQHAVKSFGRTLAEFNVLNYTEKIWGMPCSELSADWAKQRIQGLTLGSLLRSMLLKAGADPKTLVDRFYYPDQGTGLIYETIRKKTMEGNRYLLEQEPARITHRDHRIETIELQNGTTLHPQQVISSVPITEFIHVLQPAPPQEVFDAVKTLRFRSQVYLFLTVNKPQISRDQWEYFPGPEVPFARISEMKNFSAKMSPPNKTSLFIEFFVWEGDAIWNMSKEALFALAMPWLEKLDLVKSQEVMDIYHFRSRNAYPVYDMGYKERLAVVKNYMDRFENLQYVGRPGRFKYTNQDHSLEMGILAARGILEGRKFDLDLVGAEQEYFEQGATGS